MTAIAYILLGLYTLSLVIVTMYCVMQCYLLFHYLRRKRDMPCSIHYGGNDIPFVTIQLPLYNEPHVAGRLVDCACALNYPRDRIQIQVLDDSDDATTEIVAERVRALRQDGVDIMHIRRQSRQGYKAGALQYGLEFASGEFIAIFDADFVPQKDFLLNIIGAFSQDDVAVVQARWDHLNECHSLLTRLQAFQLNVHFTVEQSGRHAARLPLQFNGTAGVWRKSAIEHSGGWHGDTLTEDLDLSYRAQINGWRIVYLEDIGAPAELPELMPAFKTQQYRWMKGGAETARKILPQLWRSNMPFRSKIMASHHLLGSSIFVCVFILGVLSVPLMWSAPQLGINMQVFSFCMIGLMSTSFMSIVGNTTKSTRGTMTVKKLSQIFLYLPGCLALSMGLSLQNTLAVLRGFMGIQSPFIRTQKLGNKLIRKHVRFNSQSLRISAMTYFEGALSVYFLFALIYGMSTGDHAMIAFHLLLMLGFGGACYLTVRHTFTSPVK